MVVVVVVVVHRRLAYLGIRRLELDAELLSSGDDDLHLRDAVAVHNVAVREELVLREASADLNDLHLLEDGALARLARTCVDRRDKDDDDDESHERANEWRLSILRSLPLAVPRGSLDSKGKAAAASVPSRSSLTSSCDSWLMSFISVSIWRLRFAFFLSSAVWPWQVLPMVGWLIGRLVGCREVKDGAERGERRIGSSRQRAAEWVGLKYALDRELPVLLAGGSGGSGSSASS